MTDATPRFALPFIVPGQAQKELFHNEALTRIDLLVQAAVEGAPLAAAPAAPLEGQCWIVAPGADGPWSGRDNHLAMWTQGGWRFGAPAPGMRVWTKASGYWVHWKGACWSAGELPATGVFVNGQQVVGSRKPAILSPSGGTTIDAEARTALGQVIATLMSHGLIG